MEKRGLFFDLENITIPNVTNFQETLKALLKVPLTIITFDNMPKEKESDMREMKAKSERMYKRASHMLYAMERWKKREEILKELDKGNNIFVINYCFKEIGESVCEDLDIEWAKTHYTGLIRPDKVLYFELNNSGINKYFSHFKYLYKIKDNKLNSIINDISQCFINVQNEYNKNNIDDFSKNFYSNSIGEDLFMYTDI
jgi:thymidylate kinase